jgi:hypothetical protein
MLRNTLTSLAVAALAFAALPAGAFTMDFVAEAAGNEHSFLTETFTNVDGSGIDVTASARLLADTAAPFDTAAPYGYLDDLSGGNDGGLGVCPTANCGGSPEDNISLREVAIVEFSKTVEITSISFSNGDHFDVYNGFIGIHEGPGNPTIADSTDTVSMGHVNNVFDTSTLAAGVLSGLSLIGDRFQFVAPESFLNASTGETYKIYVSSITFEEFPVIPEPSSALLAGMGLLGLLAAGRRTRRA